MQIVHLSTVHPRNDPRIFEKEAVSLVKMFPGTVTVVVADGLGDQVRLGVEIIDLGKIAGGRIRRFLLGSWRALRRLRSIRPRIVHFHDPELIFVGLALKLFGTKVVYDVHEDVPRHVMQKRWLPPFVRRPLSLAIEFLEKFAAHFFDAIVTVTPHIANRFPATKTTIVANFADGKSVGRRRGSKRISGTVFIYSGNITQERGAIEMIEALDEIRDLDPKLILAGKFNEPGLEDALTALPGWDLVEFRGWLGKEQLDARLMDADVGLCVLHSTPSYEVAYPTKIFEYMKFGLPVIGSDLQTTREIVEDERCGVIISPGNSLELADAMRTLSGDPAKRKQLGNNGQRAFDAAYNWASQTEKLLECYEEILRS